MENPNLDALFQLQKKSLPRLKNSSPKERKEKLLALKTWILVHKEEIRFAVHSDLSKPATEVDISEISIVLHEISHAVKHLSRWMKPKKVNTPIQFIGTKGFIHYEPMGNSLIISPWNYPFNLSIGPLISAIAAGCAVILKPSEFSPSTSTLIKKMVAELFSMEEVAVVEGDKSVVQELLTLPFDKLFFTGSPKTGKLMMEAAAKHHFDITLELGGKSPVLLDRGYSLKDAAEKIAWAKWLNCGQTCIAPDYVLVNDLDYESILDHLAETVKKMYDHKDKGINKSADYARIINKQHHLRLQHLISDALSKGAKCFMGEVHDLETLYFSPTVLTQTNENMEIMKEEIFGPILPVLKYTLLEEAVSIIGKLPKPLAMYVFTEESFVKDYVLSNTSSGGVCFNDCAVQFGHSSLPFGGVNQSGLGKSHGFFGFKAFSNERAVLHQGTSINLLKSVYPPYTFKSKKITDFFLRWV
ncbi:aldehyde dehydrogenase family protein [Pleomorphovibrio marinus]|uniref:aldehyde dehydrogenase family protein n=1 Tax=Pleomorphovibrio marinus TaxID=2164132 RepID=UPI001E34BF2C|nr:aldehyde dehydrogenase family protein [Pleomorphovibrio marinus]